MKEFLVAILFACLSSIAFANDGADTPLDRLTRWDELDGWQAVGRVDQAGGGFCTGALIAPDLVLTAAHCLVKADRLTAIDPAHITFRAGYRDGTAVAVRNASQTVVHPDYIDPNSGRTGALTTDIGLIKLAAPIPTNQAMPFAIGNQSVGDAVSVVSYARGRSEALSWQRSCSVHQKWEDDGAAAYTCDVTFGSSGAPVFDLSGPRPEIVSVMSRIRSEGGRIIAYGPLIRDPIITLQNALQNAQGVNVDGGGLASVVNRTTGARFMKPGQNSRFIKP